eukprot:jgi/Mesen1/5810/ME000293S04956
MQKADAEGPDVQVTWQDQQNINTFGRLNNRIHEIADEIKAKKDMAENLEDAGNELILADDDEVRYLTGEVFIRTPKDDVDDLLEKLKDETNAEITALEDEREKILDQMAGLKKLLYAKFKDAINLEED